MSESLYDAYTKHIKHETTEKMKQVMESDFSPHFFKKHLLGLVIRKETQSLGLP